MSEVGRRDDRGGASGIGAILFPHGVRTIHFLTVPAIGMAIALGLFRLVDRFLEPHLGATSVEAWHVARTLAIALLMSSLIGWLAYRYRGKYEAQLREHNETLEQTRDFLGGIIEGSAEAIITRDLDGRVTSWNPAAREIYGWSAEEMIGQDIRRLIPDDPTQLEDLASIEARLRAGATVQDYEARRVRKDGKPITVSVTMGPIRDAAGGLVGTVGIVRDVTALKEMEARLVERERLAAVGELAAMVAHEVRNPLAGIRGGCEILLEGHAAGDPRAEIGREVIHQVDRLNRTTQDLLLFARPKALDPVPTDLHALLDRAVGLAGKGVEDCDVGYVREFDADLPIVDVDGRKMEQVFLNLAMNAMQMMGRAGTLTVRTRSLPDGVAITFRDTGPGIPRERAEHVFKPFYTTRSQGTGLGLAICKQIVEAHGGRIEASSPAGGGAEFVVTLPRQA